VLINAIIYTFAADDADRAADLLRELRDTARQEPGCLRFDVARALEHPNVFALHEEYADEAALKTHLASDAFNRLGLNGIRLLAKERVGYTCAPLD
jgi:quinol monooxygenase YgiN